MSFTVFNTPNTFSALLSTNALTAVPGTPSTSSALLSSYRHSSGPPLRLQFLNRPCFFSIGLVRKSSTTVARALCTCRHGGPVRPPPWVPIQRHAKLQYLSVLPLTILASVFLLVLNSSLSRVASLVPVILALRAFFLLLIVSFLRPVVSSFHQ